MYAAAVSPPLPQPVSRVRDALDRFIHHHVTELVLLGLILASVGMMLLELLVGEPWSLWLTIAGDALTLVFVVELTIRFYVAPKKSRFIARYWLDILAVIPLIRPLRFFRVLRVLRLWRAGVLANRRISAFHGKLRGTVSEVLSIMVGTSVLVIAAAMVIFLAETGPGAQLSTFEDALWYATFSLVAAEPTGADPQTQLGRWTTLMLMIGGLTLFGMFVGTVSAGMVSRLSANLEVHEMDLDELTGHVIVCGWNGSGPTILRELFSPNAPGNRAVVLVTELPDPPPDIPDEIPRERLYHHHGDYTLIDVLETVGMRKAEQAILLADARLPRSRQDQDARTVLAALTIERMVPHVYTVVEMHTRQSEDLLRMAGVEEIVIGDWYAGTVIGSCSRNRGLVSVLEEILTARHGNSFHTLSLTPRWDGRPVAELHQQLLSDQHAVLISIEREEEGKRLQRVNPEPDFRLRSGDQLVVLARGPVRL